MNPLPGLAKPSPSPPPPSSPSGPDAGLYLQAYTDTRSIGRKALWTLAAGLGGFFVWAAVAPLNEGIPTQATVAIDTKRKSVQHLTGGLIKEVLVREGDRVEAGQVLFRLDESGNRANFESIRQRYLGLSAMKTRLLAEQAGSDRLAFEPDVQAAAAQDPFVLQQTLHQRQLFETRQQALTTDLQGLQEALEGQRSQLASVNDMQTHRRQQLVLLKEELQNITTLVREGFAPRNRQLELERVLAELQANLAELQGSAQRTRRAMSELELRMRARRLEHRRDIETQLAELARELKADGEKYAAQQSDLERTVVRAPASGQVVGLAVQTQGAVVQPGQRLLDVVPADQQLLLEARIPPHLIDKISAGLPADIRFNAFAQSPQLVLQGKVLSVSADLLTDPATPQSPYFLTRLEVTPEGMQQLGGRRMQAGMPAEVVILTGERSMLTYLLHPLTRRLARSTKEE